MTTFVKRVTRCFSPEDAEALVLQMCLCFAGNSVLQVDFLEYDVIRAINGLKNESLFLELSRVRYYRTYVGSQLRHVLPIN